MHLTCLLNPRPPLLRHPHSRSSRIYRKDPPIKLPCHSSSSSSLQPLRLNGQDTRNTRCPLCRSRSLCTNSSRCKRRHSSSCECCSSTVYLGWWWKGFRRQSVMTVRVKSDNGEFVCSTLSISLLKWRFPSNDGWAKIGWWC